MLRQRHNGKSEILPPSKLEAAYYQQKNQPSVVEDDASSDQSRDSKTSSGKSKSGPRGAMGKEAIAKDEGKMKKILVRLVTGLAMMAIFASLMYMGHVYICGLVALVEALLFRELVKVRYNTFFHIIEDNIPLFRTTQTIWFMTSIFYTYSDFIVEVMKGNPELHYLSPYAKLQPYIAFSLYSITFVITISTMQPGHIKFQLNQLCWTIVVLCLIVGQLKYIMHNIYNGFFWFTLPIMLVVTNDTCAYMAGMLCGRKFIHRSFNELSPNKTWEGAIGGGICTLIMGWHLSKILAQFSWMTCPTNQFALVPASLTCTPDPIFLEASSVIPTQIFDVFPSALIKMVPGIVDVCAVDGDFTNLAACVSGENSHTHHHFELVIKGVLPVQIHALCLALFASFVAPFGGFLASAIKRAYGVKDFDSIIPGHGGFMDRFDCQLLMALCTWVHYNTFVKMTTVSVPKVMYMYSLLKESEQAEFFEKIAQIASQTTKS